MTSSTLSGDELSALAEPLARQEALGLVIAWSAHEPLRVGELALIPPSATEPRVLGRGEEGTHDPGPRAIFTRSRPDNVQPTGSLTAPRLSRMQLLLRAHGTDFLEVENTGRCPLVSHDQPVSSMRLNPGETLQLGNQFLFLCVKRPLLPPKHVPYPPMPFGEADAYGIVGETPAVWSLRQQLFFVGRRNGHALLRGASGSGKELAARAIHDLSDRARSTIVTRNAVTIPETLVDAELFGNLRDYPNKGMPERLGLVGQADASTLFLDEIGELPAALQAHLLRVLDNGEYHRLGESKARLSDFRLIAATNRADPALKHDLFARFAFVIDVPDLNGRREDVPLLIRFLLRRIAARDAELKTRLFSPGDAEIPRVSIALTRQLVEHHYSANVRELEALLWQAVMDSDGELLEPLSETRQRELKPAPTRPASAAAETALESELDASGPDSLTAARVQAALDEHNGVIEAAWRALGLKNRYVLTRLMAKYGIEVRRSRGRQLRRPPGRGPSH